MQARSVQYTSKEQVLLAYQEQGIPSLAIMQGKQFMFRFISDDVNEGSEYLEKILDSLVLSASAAIYTLCLYENKNGGIITSSTPYDLSFNFRFAVQSQSQNFVPNMGSPREVFPVFMSRMEKLEEQISELRNELAEKDDEGQGDELGLIGRLLENPAIQNLLTGLISQKQITASSQAATVGSIPESGLNGPNISEKLFQAIIVLQQHDNKLDEHLTKLAAIAAEKPKKFKALLSALELM